MVLPTQSFASHTAGYKGKLAVGPLWLCFAVVPGSCEKVVEELVYSYPTAWLDIKRNRLFVVVANSVHTDNLIRETM